jgi:uncharacterized protein YcbK (DUF882 family)
MSNEDATRQDRLARRGFLRLAVVAPFVALSPLRAAASAPAARPRALAFYNTHTGESLRTTYWADGRLVPEGANAIDRVLRDHRSDEIHPIDPRLLDLLHRLVGVLDAREPLHVISGYRSAATNALLRAHSRGVASRSLHLVGEAIDFRVPGRSLASVRRAALALRAGGVGYYPASDFVHVDVGRVRWW